MKTSSTKVDPQKCPHETVEFRNLGYALVCPKCGQQWVAHDQRGVRYDYANVGILHGEKRVKAGVA